MTFQFEHPDFTVKTHEAPRLDMRNAVHPWLARQLALAGPQSFKEPAYQPETGGLAERIVLARGGA